MRTENSTGTLRVSSGNHFERRRAAIVYHARDARYEQPRGHRADPERPTRNHDFHPNSTLATRLVVKTVVVEVETEFAPAWP